jgi:hypothetical protein
MMLYNTTYLWIVYRMSTIESLNNVDEITKMMNDAIKKGANKIKEKRKRASNKSSENQSEVIQMCIPSSGGGTNDESATSFKMNTSTSIEVETIKICKGEKRKGGRCSRKAKKGEYCEIHTTERKEIERKEEGGIYKYKKGEEEYDIEEIKRRGM